MSSPSPSSRVLLSVEDAANRLSISRTRLYGLLKTGDIASVRIGRLRRVPAEAIAEFITRLAAEQASRRPPTPTKN
jgi:excisionase family DNA binding protein